jgi:hypothetical protein
VRRTIAVLGIAALALLVASCRDEDLDGVERASRIEAARAEAERLHEGASFLVTTFTEVDGVEALGAATGFDVVVPRRLPEGIEVRWGVAQRELDDAQPDGPEEATASVILSRAGGQVLLQLSESRGGSGGDGVGERVAIGDDFGWLSDPGDNAPPNTATMLTFDGCGLRFRLLAASSEDPPRPFTAEELVAIAGATLDGCPSDGLDDPEPGPRYFLARTIEAANVEALNARLGEDAVLPSYLPVGATPTWVRGFPLLPTADDGPDGRDVGALYELASGNLLLTESTRVAEDTDAGDDVRIGRVRGRLSHQSSDNPGVRATLSWADCGLRFSLMMSTFGGRLTAPALADEELIRVAESILEGCE